MPTFAEQAARTRAEADVRVTLVLLDTVVTDKEGNPIRGIAAEEFELLVDNSIVPLESVEEICPATERAEDGSDPAGRTPQAQAGAGSSPHHYILFFDMSHLKIAARRKSIDIAQEFVRERMTAGDRAMILAFSRGLHLVSGFSGDRDFLVSRLERMEEDRALIDTAPFEQEMELTRLARPLSGGYAPPGGASRGLRAMSAAAPFNPECLAQARIAEIETTRAIRAIANTMPAFSTLPGRKALMLFTQTLQADPAQAYYGACGVPYFDRPSLGLTVAPEILDLAHRANLAGVSFYPMHAGGIEEGRTGPVMDQSLAFQKSIALGTGGEAFIVMRDPLVAFEQAASDLSCYYLLAYRVDEALTPGRHTAVVRVARKKVRVRHRESFVLQTSEEASEQQMLAVLSNPGLYRDLPVAARGYTLSDAGRGSRHFVIQAWVPLDELVFLPEPGSGSTARVHLRGGVISAGKLACEFSGTHDIKSVAPRGDADGEAGVQALCSLEEGDYEMVVAGRDEVGGALGTFWGKFSVGGDDGGNTSGALLWAPASGGSWSRLGEESWLPSIGGSGEPLFIRHSLTLAAGESGVLTFNACRSGGKPSAAAGALAAASITLRGQTAATFHAVPSGEDPLDRCELLGAEIRPGSLPPGTYDILPSVGDPWTPTGSPVRLRVE